MRKILKWVGIVLGGLVLLLLLAAGGLYARGRAQFNRTLATPAESVVVPVGAGAVERGQHLATVHCAGCHGREMEGEVIFQSPALGSLTAPGIAGARGKEGRLLSDDDLARAIRHGVGADGRPLMVMPSEAFYFMNDQDLGALIAYLKSEAPVENSLPGTRFTPLGMVLIGAGAFGEVFSADKIDPAAARTAVEPGATAAYGNYLATIGECRVCHGANLTGGKDPNPDAPPAPDLTPSGELGGWSDKDFLKALRTGITPSGRLLNGEFMPWPFFGQMTDDEIHAVWLYLQTLTTDNAAQ